MDMVRERELNVPIFQKQTSLSRKPPFIQTSVSTS